MATENFNRQFIMLDFNDLNNPEFMAFVRAPEFSTYLVMRRYVWRSDKVHALGLHEYYAQGLLACALNREKLAKCLGGVSPRQVSRDINTLIERQVIRSVETGRGNIFILGKWAIDPEEKVYYEYFYLDRLHISMDKNVQSGWTSDEEGGQESPGGVDKSVQTEWTKVSTINREINKEINKEDSNLSKSPSPSIFKKSSPAQETASAPDDKEGEPLVSAQLETLIDVCSREFRDVEHLKSNLTHVFNLWAQTDLVEAEMMEKTLEARKITKQRISSSTIRDRDKKMPYFFAVLQDVLGLKES